MLLSEQASSCKSLWEYVVNNSEAIDSLNFFTKYSAYFGHTMSFSKLKSSIDFEDIFQYSPEFGHVVPIPLAALRKSSANVHFVA